jgi:transcriptional regulator with GAF, ATPase, and Fis domain
MATGELVDPACMELDMEDLSQQQTKSLTKNMPSQKEHVINVLEQNDYVIAKAARVLNISRPSLYALIKKYGIDRDGM